MIDRLIARSNDAIWEFPLGKASAVLGSSPALELSVPHSEVPARAVTIDNRGASLLIVNHNPYPIYVGSVALEPDACMAWGSNEPVQLTRSVTLEAHHAQSQQQDSDRSGGSADQGSGDAKSQIKQVSQLTVIALCLLGSALLLFRDNVAQAARPTESFKDLLADAARLQKGGKSNESTRRLVSALQDAQVAELRWGSANPQRVIDVYRQLLETEAIRRPTGAQQELAGRVKRFGSERIKALWRQLDYR